MFGGNSFEETSSWVSSDQYYFNLTLLQNVLEQTDSFVIWIKTLRDLGEISDLGQETYKVNQEQFMVPKVKEPPKTNGLFPMDKTATLKMLRLA